MVEATPRVRQEHVEQEVIARWANERDRDGIVETMCSSFDRWPSFRTAGASRDYLDWWLSNPHGSRGSARVLEIDQRVAAAGLRIVRPVHVRGALHSAYLESYVAVHPDFRGRGLFRTIDQFGETAPEQVSWALSAVAQIAHIGDEKGDRHPANPFSIWVAQLRAPSEAPGTALRSRVTRAAGYAGMALWSSTVRAAPRLPSRAQVHEVDRFDERIGYLWRPASSQFDFIPYRDTPYLNWRYRDPRGGAFDCAVVEEGELLLGYVVTRRGEKRTHIVDVLVDPARPDALRALLRWVFARAHEADSEGVECWLMQHHPYVRTLRQFGFLRMHARSAELAQRLRLDSQHVAPGLLTFIKEPRASIHLVEGDTDLT